MTQHPAPSDRQHEVTRLLSAIQRGDRGASDDLLPIVYDELRRLAHQRMANEPADHTLPATALVHEAYLRLVGDDPARAPEWDNRGHFFAAAAEAMRRTLVERARRYQRIKHGAGRKRVDLEGVAVVGNEPAVDLIALDAALEKLQAYDARKHQVVLLRYFAGLTIDQTAAALDISPATVKNDWTFARSWLHRELSEDATP